MIRDVFLSLLDFILSIDYKVLILGILIGLFIKIKVNQTSLIAMNDGGVSETLLNEKLEASQHLAESTACLYDADKNMLIIARNRDGVMPSVIIDFLRYVTRNRKLTYGIIPSSENIKSNEAKIYRRVLIGIKDLDKLQKNEKKKLFDIKSVGAALKGFEGYGYCNIKIELSMGKAAKNQSMSNNEVNEVTMELMESGVENITKLELSTKEDTESNIETIDLLNNKIKDNFSLGYTRREPITFEKSKNKLLESYNRKKETIYRLI